MDDATIVMLRELIDTGEVVLAREPTCCGDPYDAMWHVWDEAQEQAELAYAAWQSEPGRRTYAVYLAAQDRADAAQDALARLSRRAR